MSASVITMSFLDCSSCIAFHSLIVSFEYFDGRLFSIFSWISLRVASIFVSMLWWLLAGIQLLFVDFFEFVFFRRQIFIFLISETSSKISSNCFFIVSLLIVFCVGTKVIFLFRNLKVSLQNRFVLRLITCPAWWDWNLIVSSSVFSNLIKLPWFVRWSLWRWSVRYFLLGPCQTQKPGTRFLNLHVCLMILFLLLLLDDCSLFFLIF